MPWLQKVQPLTAQLFVPEKCHVIPFSGASTESGKSRAWQRFLWQGCVAWLPPPKPKNVQTSVSVASRRAAVGRRASGAGRVGRRPRGASVAGASAAGRVGRGGVGRGVCVCVYHLNRCKTSYWFSLVCRGRQGRCMAVANEAPCSWLGYGVWSTPRTCLFSDIARGQAKNPNHNIIQFAALVSQSGINFKIYMHQNLP